MSKFLSLQCWRAYKDLMEPDLEYFNDNIWLLPPSREFSTLLKFNEFCLLFFKRQLLRILAIYINRNNISPTYNECKEIIYYSWTCYTRQPLYSVGHWLSQIICGPITQKSLDKIHEKTITIETMENDNYDENKIFSILYRGKKITNKDKLSFHLNNEILNIVYNIEILEKIYNTNDCTMIEKYIKDEIIITKKLLIMNRPIGKLSEYILLNVKNLNPSNLVTMTLWKVKFNTIYIQKYIQNILLQCVTEGNEHWSVPAMRLLSNIVTIDGYIKPINRRHINKDRDIISQALFETPKQLLLYSKEKKYKLSAPAAFFFGLPNTESEELTVIPTKKVVHQINPRVTIFITTFTLIGMTIGHYLGKSLALNENKENITRLYDSWFKCIGHEYPLSKNNKDLYNPILHPLIHDETDADDDDADEDICEEKEEVEEDDDDDDDDSETRDFSDESESESEQYGLHNLYIFIGESFIFSNNLIINLFVNGGKITINCAEPINKKLINIR
ncbi:hypothetical protein PV326_001622 [Microctonus aethiopoides]|nr:hypothetical protein PV326_001622 [Microctonus aethiopoides]